MSLNPTAESDERGRKEPKQQVVAPQGSGQEKIEEGRKQGKRAPAPVRSIL